MFIFKKSLVASYLPLMHSKTWKNSCKEVASFQTCLTKLTKATSNENEPKVLVYWGETLGLLSIVAGWQFVTPKLLSVCPT